MAIFVGRTTKQDLISTDAYMVLITRLFDQPEIWIWSWDIQELIFKSEKKHPTKRNIFVLSIQIKEAQINLQNEKWLLGLYEL